MTDDQRKKSERIAQARARAKARFDALDAQMKADIVELRRADVPLRAIAEVYGLNHQTVQNIVDRAAKAQ
jgi:transposase-like protein